MKQLKNKAIALALCAALLWSMAACTNRDEQPPVQPESQSTPEEPVVAGERIVPDFAQVTAGIDLIVPEELALLQPQKDVQVEGENYYITGRSDPSVPLLLNKEAVEARGELGSFGVYVELAEGENTFVFTQGDASETVTITRQAEATGTTSKITRPYPEGDDVVAGGDSYTLRCVAPAGAGVTAQVQGQTIPLEQQVPTAEKGVPATFSAEFAPEQAEDTVNLGEVTYTLTWEGEQTTYPSKGSLFVGGTVTPVLVRAKDVSATVFAEEDTESDYYSTIKQGAVDVVTQVGADMYQLAMGGWVVKSSLEPLTTQVELENQVSGVEYTVEREKETLVLTGTAAAPYKVEEQEGRMVVTFYRTSGVDGFTVRESRLFRSVEVSEAGGNTAIAFLFDPGHPPWGYLVEYREDGILLTLKVAPKLAAGAKPLWGITIMLDPGHGGSDIGTAGIVGSGDGLVEKDITLATADAVGRYLETLGATVLMTRTGDETVTMNDRLGRIQQPEVDFMISLHGNSIPAGRDGTGPSGTEVYYYEDAAAPLAKTVLSGICQRTGRDVRSTLQGNYKITLNSNAPSIMVEMGFMTNPWEYDNLCSKQAIYDTAAAIGDGIITMLS